MISLCEETPPTQIASRAPMGLSTCARRRERTCDKRLGHGMHGRRVERIRRSSRRDQLPMAEEGRDGHGRKAYRRPVKTVAGGEEGKGTG